MRDENFENPSGTPLDPIFALVLVGRTNRQIADQLGLDRAEVERVVGIAKLQLGVRTRQEAALIIATRSQGLSGLAGINLQAGENRGHFEPRSAIQTTRLVNTKSEQNLMSAYVRDVGSNISGSNVESDVLGEGKGLNSLFDGLNSVQVVKNLWLLFMIVMIGAFALGSLVSAMQGFDILLNA